MSTNRRLNKVSKEFVRGICNIVWEKYDKEIGEMTQ